MRIPASDAAHRNVDRADHGANAERESKDGFHFLDDYVGRHLDGWLLFEVVMVVVVIKVVVMIEIKMKTEETGGKRKKSPAMA